MKSYSLRSCSTFPTLSPSQKCDIYERPARQATKSDCYILVSIRWSSSVRASKTSWGTSINVHGRIYDHALVQIVFKTRLKCSRKSSRKDFTALKQPDIVVAHKEHLQTSLESTPCPITANEQ